MSPFISVARRARRRPAPPVIAVLLATTVLLASFALPAFGLSPTKLIAEALSTAKKADKDAKKADKDARSADTDAKNSSVGTVRLQDGAVTADKLAGGAVGSTQLATGGVASVDLANGAVTAAKLAAGSVGSSQIVPGSVSIDDLSGTSANTTFTLPAVGADTCSTAEVSDPGATTTDFPMVSFPGPSNLPLQVSATVLRVDAAGSVRVKFCNGTATNAGVVTNVNVEIVTLR
jgi:streptogramin lyase